MYIWTCGLTLHVHPDHSRLVVLDLSEPDADRSGTQQGKIQKRSRAAQLAEPSAAQRATAGETCARAHQVGAAQPASGCGS